MKRIFLALISFLAVVSCSDDTKNVIDLNDKKDPVTTNPDDEKPTPSTPSGGNSTLQGTLPVLHTDGRWLVNAEGEHVNLHGFWQTYTPWFNGGAWGENNWGGKDYEGCVNYNKRIIDGVIASGIKVDFMRMHMDPYWFIRDGRGDSPVTEFFSAALMREYFEKVYLPIIQYCNSKGLYVVLRAYGPDESDLYYGDAFFKLMETMWNYFSTHSYLRNNSDVMFELANEPVGINTSQDGGDREKAASRYMQHFVDLIRGNSCDNIIWVPGLTWQQDFAGFVKYPLKGENIGFAVHCYPGWYGSDAIESTGENGGNMGQGMTGGYDSFQAGWDRSITPAAELRPIMITEMDWAVKAYNKTWGKSITGLAGGTGFGANFKYIVDKCGNVSYITFTAPNDLALYAQKSAESTTNFYNDPEACPWQIYHWYASYREGLVQPTYADELKIGRDQISLAVGSTRDIIVNAINNKVVYPLQTGVELVSSNPSVARVDGKKIVAESAGTATITAKALGLEVRCTVTVTGLFPVVSGVFLTDIWEKGTLDEATKTFTTGQYGFCGWKYSGLDISGHKYIVVKLGAKTDFSCNPSFRLFDKGYWDGAAEYNITSTDPVKIEIAKMEVYRDNKLDRALDTKNINIIGFWTLGGKPVQIEDIYFED